MILPNPRAGLFNLFLAGLLAFACALLVLFGFAAHAQTVLGNPAPASSGIGSILLGFLTPANLAGAVVAALGLLGGLQVFTAQRKKVVALCAHHAFLIVEDVVDNLADGPAKDGFKKADEGLKIADQWMAANGWRPLKPDEQAAVALTFKAMNGSTVVAAAQAAVAPLPR